MFTRRSLPLLFAFALLASTFFGCGLLNPASRLYGKWKLDVDATIDRATGGNAWQAGVARLMLAGLGGDMSIEFRDDGTGRFMFGRAVESGKWTVARADAESIVVAVTSDRTNQTDEMQLMMKGEDTFEYPFEDGKVLIFRRVQP